MKRFLATILAILVSLAAEALAQGPNDLNSGSQLLHSGTSGACTFSWWGVAGNTYLIETSDDLINWSYLPIVESGTGAAIQWGFSSSSGSLFMKLEYITVPASELSGVVFNGPLDTNGLPGDWELFYYGQQGVDPNATVPWSNGSVTNQQAYQQNLNPIDYYAGAVPTMSSPGGTTVSGSGGAISVLVTDQYSDPLIGAPVSYSINYGAVESIGSTADSQTVQVSTGTNGLASVTVLPPWWAGSSFTVTAQAVGQATATQQYNGTTTSAISNYPPNPTVAAAPTPIQEPDESVQSSSTYVSNPAFRQFEVYDSTTEQFTDTPPIHWYLISTENGNGVSTPVDESGGLDAFVATYTGTYNSAGTVHPLFSGTTWTGYSQDVFDETLNGAPFQGADSISFQNDDGSWSGNTSWYTPTESGTSQFNTPAWGPDESVLLSQSTTEKNFGWTGDAGDFYLDDVVLSDEYTSNQFVSDAVAALPAFSPWGSEYLFGSVIAWRHLASDSSSVSVASGTYQMTCTTTGTVPYKYEWYEVFEPDDSTQPLQVTHREWDNASQQASSPSYTLDPTTQQVNGVWYLASMDVHERVNIPACGWRHSLGPAEVADVALLGFASNVSGSATWTATGGTLQQSDTGTPSQTGTGEAVIFTAGTGGAATITATLPGGATMTTNLTIVTPTGMSMTWIKSDPQFIAGEIGAGFYAYWTVLPTSVSFANISTAERPCHATNKTGFYLKGGAPDHNPNGQSHTGDTYNANPPYGWIPVQADNTSNGTDWVSVGPLSIINTTEAGSFEWDIPWKWKLSSDSNDADAVSFPSPIVSTFTIDASGNATATKDGVSDTRSPSGSESHQP